MGICTDIEMKQKNSYSLCVDGDKSRSKDQFLLWDKIVNPHWSHPITIPNINSVPKILIHIL